MSTSTVTAKRTEAKRTPSEGEECATVLCNCNCHTFDSVISQLMHAVGCSFEAARRYAEIAHGTGKVSVYRGERDACEAVADKLAEIGLVVRVRE